MLVRRIARPLLATVFVSGGWNAFWNPGQRHEKAATIGLPASETLVRVNAAVMAVAGTSLGLGTLPRLSALVLAGTIVPTTAAGHRFWEETDPASRAQQQIHFQKNLGLLGGLLLAGVDTEGHESRLTRLRRRGRLATTVARRALPVG